jgi:peptidoglycan/xylan/chitin deacetylase (PgdA/CDA1 family)
MRAILTYHSVDDSGSPISIDPASFRRHVKFLALRGPRIVTVDQLLGMPTAVPAAAITFDDAFVNFADVAWPIMREYNLPVTLYVPSDFTGTKNTWSAADRFIPQLPLLDWDALARLREEGVTLGSHTCSHPHLTRLSDERVRDELERSAEQIERMTGARPTGLAYPYGAHDTRVMAAASKVYDHACTTDLRPLHHEDDAYRLPRLDAYYLRSEGALESWESPQLRLYLRARAGARRARQLLTFAAHR